MRTKQTLPIFRSDTQGRILAELYLHPEREHTVTELIRITRAQFNNVYREVNALTTVGFVKSRRSGRNRYLSANMDHPLFGAIQQITLYAYGPLALLPDLLKDVNGLQGAWIFGSWARRYLGEQVPAVGDLDVLLLGDGLRNGMLTDLGFEASKRLGIETNFAKMPVDTFTSSMEPFARTVRESPRVEVGFGGIS